MNFSQEQILLCCGILQTIFTILGPITQFFQNKQIQSKGGKTSRKQNQNVEINNTINNGNIQIQQQILSLDNNDSPYSKSQLNIRRTLKFIYNIFFLLVIFYLLIHSGINIKSNDTFGIKYIIPMINTLKSIFQYLNIILLLILIIIFVRSCLTTFKGFIMFFINFFIVIVLNLIFIKIINPEEIIKSSSEPFLYFQNIVISFIILFNTIISFSFFNEIIFGVGKYLNKEFTIANKIEVDEETSKFWLSFIPIITYILYISLFYIFQDDIIPLINIIIDLIQTLLQDIFKSLTSSLK